MNTPQSLPNKITVVLTQDHFLRSGGYYSHSNCALAVALKDHFITPTPIRVGGTFVKIGMEKTYFKICDEVAGDGIDLIGNAYSVIKDGGEIKPIIVELFKKD